MTTALVPALTVAKFQATPQGLQPLDSFVPLDVGATYLAGLAVVEDAVPMVIGDALEALYRWHGEDFAQAIPEGVSKATWIQRRWVASRVPWSVRQPGLTYSHYRTVAALDVEEQASLLTEAAAEGWSTRELRRAVGTKPVRRRVTCPECGHEWELGSEA
ncbi:MAG: hypothetical protein ACE5HE_08830 [Phycisphaerae bacterium]